MRAENLEVAPKETPGAIPGEVLVVEPLGSHNLLTVAVGGERVKAITDADDRAAAGDSIWLVLPQDKLWWLDRESGRAVPSASQQGVAQAH